MPGMQDSGGPSRWTIIFHTFVNTTAAESKLDRARITAYGVRLARRRPESVAVSHTTARADLSGAVVQGVFPDEPALPFCG